VACSDQIWKSDTLIPQSLKDRLVAGVAKLENVPESEKDWHPRSNGQVLDLLHPSLYPIVYGRTLAYPEGCTDRDASQLKVLPPPELPDARPVWGRVSNYHISQKFQWLPTDFLVSDDGSSVKSVNYINNLHPDRHADLHKAIEDIIATYIPLFEHVLTDSIPQNNPVPNRTSNEYSYDEDYKPCPKYKEDEDADKDEDADNDKNGDKDKNEVEDKIQDEDKNEGAHEDANEEAEGEGEGEGEVGNEDEEDDVDEYDRLYRAWEEGRPIYPPEVPAEGYVLGSLEARSKYTLAGRTVQVIVKLANIHLVSLPS
jgi:hypothetical protein